MSIIMALTGKQMLHNYKFGLKTPKQIDKVCQRQKLCDNNDTNNSQKSQVCISVAD